jgi:acyl-CoA synthetase (AMP-forming)/AMP-acid ligase II
MIATNSISTAIADTEHLTLVDLLADRADRQGDRTAFIFLENGEKESAGLSYDRLNRQARTIAEHLSMTSQPGDRVLLIYPSGIDFIAAFFGCLYAGVVAVPVHPPRPNRSMERLQSILNDAGAKIALTTAAIREMVDRRMSKEPELGLVDWIVTEIADLETGDRWQPPKIDSNTLAFLQYTSGSTGQPKGVMVSHGNLLHNLAYSQQAFGLTAADVSVTWLPNFHDLGLIDGILQPIFSGILGVLMPSAAFVQKPIRWLQAISHYKATHSGGPNFAYDLCTSKITAEQMQDVDLSSWVSAYNGAEPIRAETLTKFAERFALYGYQSHFHYPCYGMAEATLVITGGEAGTAPAICTVDGEALAQDRIVLANSHTPHPRTLVSCGRTWLDTRVVIVNPDTQILCLEQQVGEIWTAGGSVAQGYWQRPVETQETFHAYLQDPKTGPFLRTGDLGFVQDGELFVTGRLKDVVIVRGSNYYPQDIEQTVDRSHPYLHPSGSAVFGISVANTEQLVVVAEVERQYSHRHQDIKTGGEIRAVTDWDDVFGQIRRAVASEHELEVYAIVLLRRGHILKTSSGKIQRRGCKAAFWEDSVTLPTINA